MTKTTLDVMRGQKTGQSEWVGTPGRQAGKTKPLSQQNGLGFSMGRPRSIDRHDGSASSYSWGAIYEAGARNPSNWTREPVAVFDFLFPSALKTKETGPHDAAVPSEKDSACQNRLPLLDGLDTGKVMRSVEVFPSEGRSR